MSDVNTETIFSVALLSFLAGHLFGGWLMSLGYRRGNYIPRTSESDKHPDSPPPKPRK